MQQFVDPDGADGQVPAHCASLVHDGVHMRVEPVSCGGVVPVSCGGGGPVSCDIKPMSLPGSGPVSCVPEPMSVVGVGPVSVISCGRLLPQPIANAPSNESVMSERLAYFMAVGGE